MVLVVVGSQLLIHVKGSPLNALAPIVVTLVGIVTDKRPVQPEKAEAEIVVTELSIITLANEV